MDSFGRGGRTTENTKHSELVVTTEFDASELSVRDSVVAIIRKLRRAGITEDDLATVEIVLAEVLNNVVEHAYQYQDGKQVLLGCWQTPQKLKFRVSDTGRSMPGNQLPEGKVDILSADVDQLPEGGFGWALIRELTCELLYNRTNGSNVVEFAITSES